MVTWPGGAAPYVCRRVAAAPSATGRFLPTERPMASKQASQACHRARVRVFHALALRGARGKGCRLLSQKAVCPFPVTGFDTRPVVQGGGRTTVPGTPESGLWLPVLGRFNQHNAASVLSAPNVSHPGGQGCPSAVRVLAKGNAHFSWSESGPVCVLTHLGAGVASELGVRVLGSSVQAGNLSPLGAESGRPGLEGR